MIIGSSHAFHSAFTAGKYWSKRQKHSSFKFMDSVVIEVCGGRVLSPGKKRPNGGNGGRGGNVILEGDSGMTSFTFETFHFNAQDGKHGGSDGLTGRNGKDLVLRIPLGTVVTERFPDIASSMSDIEIDDVPGYDVPEELANMLHIDIDHINSSIVVAEGGKPGVGNGAFAGTQNRRKSLPKTKMPGQPGHRRSLLLRLKLIADIGLVGFPNAGKSTLLAAVSNAKPKIAPYPFTTLHPSVGIVEYTDMERITLADIPGIIEGAHENKGLGFEFLRHIERTKVLLFVLDGVGSEGRDPADDLRALITELRMYDPTMLDKPALVFANKCDLRAATTAGDNSLGDMPRPKDAYTNRRLRELVKKCEVEMVVGSGGDAIKKYVPHFYESLASVVIRSAMTGEGIPELATKLRLLLEQQKRALK